MLALLSGASFLAALITGVTGLAGGVVLMSALVLFYDVTTAIALHALLQAFSNFIRVLVFRKNIDWPSALRFVSLVIPGVYLGAQLGQNFPKQAIEVALGGIILWSSFQIKPKLEPSENKSIFIVLGFVSSFLGMIVGVVGPFIAPFFIKAGLTKEKLIATKSFGQAAVQIAKVITFSSLLNFSFWQFQQEIFAMFMAILVATLLAKKVLKNISEKIFVQGLRVILVLSALKVLTQALAPDYLRILEIIS